MEEDAPQEFPEGHGTEGYISCDYVVTENPNGTTTKCFKPSGHEDNVHEDYNGNTTVTA